jgi:hypothetical protein
MFVQLHTIIIVGRDISVGIATTLLAGRSGDRIPVGARFSAPVQIGPGTYPASCTVGTVSFSGLKWPGLGVDHPSTSTAEVIERVELYLYSPSGPSWPVVGWLYFTFTVWPKDGSFRGLRHVVSDFVGNILVTIKVFCVGSLHLCISIWLTQRYDLCLLSSSCW